MQELVEVLDRYIATKDYIQGCVVVVAVGAWDIPAQGCTYEISEKKEVSIWPSFSLLAK